MAMNMRKAFSKHMLAPLTRFAKGPGRYNEYNEWIEGSTSESTIHGVWFAGNKFSQFDEGIALKPTQGGERYSDYRTLYISDRFILEIEDYIGFKGKYFKILQMSDEDVFGFRSFLLEQDPDWRPYAS
jgi:hypothetical protein